jgi:hypothetical protein
MNLTKDQIIVTDRKTIDEMKNDSLELTKEKVLEVSKLILDKQKENNLMERVDKALEHFINTIETVDISRLFTTFSIMQDEEKIGQLYYLIEQLSLRDEAIKLQKKRETHMQELLKECNLREEYERVQQDNYIEELEVCEDKTQKQTVEYSRIINEKDTRIIKIRGICKKRNDEIVKKNTLIKILLYMAFVLMITVIVFIGYIFYPEYINDVMNKIVNYEYNIIIGYIKNLIFEVN